MSLIAAHVGITELVKLKQYSAVDSNSLPVLVVTLILIFPSASQ